MTKKSVVAIVTLFFASACSYTANTDINPAINVYSNYADKLPGKYAVYVDSDEMQQDVKPSGMNCSFHTFPIDARQSFRTSTIQTFENLIETIEPVDAPPDANLLISSGYDGVIIVEVDDLDVDLKVIPGFLSSEIEADAEITARVTVDGPTGRLLGTAVEGDQDARVPAGFACDGGAQAIGKAVEEAMKETLERLGERVANAPRLRR